MLRLKMVVQSVKSVADSAGAKTSEEVIMHAVYSNEEGSANKQWSKYTPCGNLSFTISNPEAFDKVLPGQFVFIDVTATDKDAR